MPSEYSNPYPSIVRRALRRLVPPHLYRRYFTRAEIESLNLWKHLATQVEAGVILDIGAYHGEFALAARMVNHRAKIVAFEPSTLSLESLEQNTKGHDITVEPVAVGATTTKVSFFASSDHPAQSGVATHGNAMPATYETDQVSLDDYAQDSIDHPVDLVKMDVEGYEPEVLRGASKTIASDRPFIICEVLTDQAGAAVQAEISEDYVFYGIDEIQGLSRRASITRIGWRSKNWLLCPEEKNDLIDTHVQSSG